MRRCSAFRAICGCRSPAPVTTGRSTGRTSAARAASPRRSRRPSESRSTTTSRSTSPDSSVSSTRSAVSRSACRTPPRTPTPASACNPAARRSTGGMALAYARSRQYQEWSDGEWHDQDGAPDLNRIARQQHLPAHGGGGRARRGQQQPVPPRRPDRRRRQRRPSRRSGRSGRGRGGDDRRRPGRHADLHHAGQRGDDRRSVGARARRGRRRDPRLLPWRRTAARRHRVERPRPRRLVDRYDPRDDEGADPGGWRRHSSPSDHPHQGEAARAGRQQADPVLRRRGDGRRRHRGDRCDHRGDRDPRSAPPSATAATSAPRSPTSPRTRHSGWPTAC